MRFFILNIILIFLCGLAPINVQQGKSENEITKPENEIIKSESDIAKKEISEKPKNDIRENSHFNILKLKPILSDMLKNETGQYHIGIINLKNGEEVYINKENKMLPAASVIKIYIMVEYFNQIKNGELIQTKELDAFVRDMIQNSDNYATNVLIDKLGMDSINETISELGCKNTVLNRKMLDFESRLKGKDNFTSVYDISGVLKKIYVEECTTPEFDKKMLSIMKGQKRRNKIPALLPGDAVIANKTGELPVDNQNNMLGVENDAAIVMSDKMDYIICVLSNELNSPGKAVSNIKKISKRVYEFFLR